MHAIGFEEALMIFDYSLAVEDAGHIAAEHGRDRDDDRAINQNLDPANRGHDTPLRIFLAAAERR